MDLERKLSELLNELPQKQDEFEELQQRLEGAVARGRAAAAEVADLRAEAESAGTRLAWAERALRRCEEALAAAREAAAKHGLAHEAANRQGDAMRQQAHRLHVENTKLKKQMEDFQRDLKSETFFRESCIAKQAKIESAVEALCMHRQQLEKDYKEMDRHASEAILVGNKMKLMLNHKDEIIKELKGKYEELSAKTISEKTHLEEAMKGVHVANEGDYEKEIMKEWETSVNEMKASSESHEKELEELQKSLQNAVSAQLMFQKLESAAADKIKDLELKLQEAKQGSKKTITDRSVQTDAKTSIDVACETHLKLWPPMADAAAQTDPTAPAPAPAPAPAAAAAAATPPQVDEAKTSYADGMGEGGRVTPSTWGNVEVQSDGAALNYSRFNSQGYSSILSDKNLLASSSLGMLMSKFQQEQKKCETKERDQNNTQELSEMATQLNNHNKDDNGNN